MRHRAAWGHALLLRQLYMTSHAIVLGLVLGPILEQNFMVSMIKSNWNLGLFFVRPISAILGGITVICWLFPFYATFLERTKKKNSPTGQ
jgi:TctA family transporter